MYKIYRLLYLCTYLFVTVTFSLSQDSLDYSSVVAARGSTSDFPTHYPYGNLGPFTAFDRIWVFFSDGEYAVWKTKEINSGDDWVSGGYVFNVTQGRYFNVAFDGEYFHFIRAVDGDLKYMRGQAHPDGSITFDAEVTAYSDPVWKVRTTTVLPRHFTIYVDSESKVWIAVKVGDGNEITSNFKPIALSSVASDGTWESRDGFPFDLAPSFNIRGNGRALNIIELLPGNILFSWANDRESTSHPEHGMRARLWTDGLFGDIEITGLPYTAPASSVVLPENGIAMLNSGNTVARRNSDGTWSNVTPGSMTDWSYNSLSAFENRVRLWDVNNGYIRYRETEDQGETWSPISEKWPANNIINFSASLIVSSQGKHHSLLWSEGTNPYDIVIGIEGEYEPVPVPQKPVLVSPIDGETDIKINPTLKWEKAENADTYTIRVSNNSDMSNPIINESDLLNTEISISLDYETEYYWYVRAENDAGMSEWSDAWSFTTEIDVPEVPLLTSPEDGAMDQPVVLMLSWNSAERAETYHLQVSEEDDFSSLFYDNDEITETTEEIDNLDHQKEYFWRVRASNTTGTSDWSAIWNFTTVEEAPEAPVLVSPVSDAQNISVDTVFAWEEADRAKSYHIQISSDPDFSEIEFLQTDITSTEMEVAGLSHDTNYFWRVAAENSGGQSDWSEVWNFTTVVATADAPLLVSPGDGVENISTDTVLVWEPSERAETYHLQVSVEQDFTEIELDNNGIEDTEFAVSGLDHGKTYYWRVRAENAGGYSDWSEEWSFTTIVAIPVIPVLVSPQDEAEQIAVDTILVWDESNGAENYMIQVSTDSDFSEIVVEGSEITDSMFEVTGLESLTTYYWRVRAWNSAGWCDWSEVWSFTTYDVTSVRELAGGIPDAFNLEQNYPNPFNPATTIRFAIPEASSVRMEVYNMLGQLVATLIDGEHYTAGTYEAVWDARDDMGREMSSGMYIYRISAGDYVSVKKMLLMK